VVPFKRAPPIPCHARNAAEIHGFCAAVPEVRIHLPPARSLVVAGDHGRARRRGLNAVSPDRLCALHATSAAVTAVMHIPLVIVGVGRIRVGVLHGYPLDAPRERQDDAERGEADMPAHHFLRACPRRAYPAPAIGWISVGLCFLVGLRLSIFGRHRLPP